MLRDKKLLILWCLLTLFTSVRCIYPQIITFYMNTETKGISTIFSFENKDATMYEMIKEHGPIQFVPDEEGTETVIAIIHGLQMKRIFDPDCESSLDLLMTIWRKYDADSNGKKRILLMGNFLLTKPDPIFRVIVSHENLKRNQIQCITILDNVFDDSIDLKSEYRDSRGIRYSRVLPNDPLSTFFQHFEPTTSIESRPFKFYQMGKFTPRDKSKAIIINTRGEEIAEYVKTDNKMLGPNGAKRMALILVKEDKWNKYFEENYRKIADDLDEVINKLLKTQFAKNTLDVYWVRCPILNVFTKSFLPEFLEAHLKLQITPTITIKLENVVFIHGDKSHDMVYYTRNGIPLKPFKEFAPGLQAALDSFDMPPALQQPATPQPPASGSSKRRGSTASKDGQKQL